ncbi:hypothetical protein BVY03_03140 [bacterium K02(2017)]|nr:hypothetical protein BVY03_03140 [bacterium K02(2017)]
MLKKTIISFSLLFCLGYYASIFIQSFKDDTRDNNFYTEKTLITLNNLRQHISNFQKDHQFYPKNLNELITKKYIKTIPQAKLIKFGHADSSQVLTKNFIDKQLNIKTQLLEDSGNWIYDAISGKLILDCTHQDSKDRAMYNW